MQQLPWVSTDRQNLVCVDSYDNGVLKGRLCAAGREAESFDSLSQFLVKMETLLDELQQPQSYTAPRAFSYLLQEEGQVGSPTSVRRGVKATFDLRVLFRQHTSWQGVVHWRERGAEHSFRSVLELVLLMDSALRSAEGSAV